jgi:subtilisin-like proprotein convertase family protein
MVEGMGAGTRWFKTVGMRWIPGLPLVLSPVDLAGDEAWAIKLLPGQSVLEVAENSGAAHWTRIGSLADAYLLEFVAPVAPGRGEALARHPAVIWEELQVGRLRTTRSGPTAEPLFADQWHLSNTGQWGGVAGVDVNAPAAWAEGVTGVGVGVSVVDTGTEYTHPELAPNYVKGRDQWDRDDSALPVGSDENHGTAVAGIILAAVNGADGAGVAPGAGLYPMRLLRNGGAIPDSDEADALSRWPEEVFVSNNSWGPSDDNGVSLARIGSLVADTFTASANARGGRGTVYVWAAGNGRSLGQRADYDGYNANRHTISVAAIGQDGQAASFSEPGACVFIAAPSKGAGRGILTTDRVGAAGYGPGNSTESFSGTSAAAPMVSGVVALMLEANPSLGWRDVQHILARTALRTDWDDAGWFPNGGGFHLHEAYGFGRVDALGAVRLAKRWAPRPASTVAAQSSFSSLFIPDGGTASRSLIFPPGQALTVEHVEIALNLSHSTWRQLEIELVSPAGTRSVLSRPFETQNSGFGSYTLMSVQFWGEPAQGTWKLEIRDTVAGGGSGTLNSVTLRVHGTSGSAATPPTRHTATLAADDWPLRLEAEDWLEAPAAGTLEILSARPLDRGEVWEEAPGEWWFAPPADAHGTFPLALTARTDNGEARSFLVFLERPILSTDGVAPAALVGLGTSANLRRRPTYGTVTDAGGGLSYLPLAEHAGREGADRFSLGPVGRLPEVSVPVFFGRDWSVETDGRDAFVELGLGSRDLAQRFTVETWIRPEGWGEAETGFGRIFDKETFLFFLNGYTHGFYPDASLVVFADFGEGTTGAFTTPAGSIELGRWTHVAVTFDADRTPQAEVFLDGARVVVTSPSAVQPPPAGRRLASNLGVSGRMGDSLSGERGFRGGFHDLRVWSTLRSPAQIADAAAGGAPESPGTLLARLKPTRAGLAFAAMEGTLGATATFRGVAWRPTRSPWGGFRAAFPFAVENGLGWWGEERVGRLFADHFPWAYAEELGWLWVHAEPDGAPSRWFYRSRGGLGWIYWSREQLPWLYSAREASWLYHLRGTDWFYRATTEEWILRR